jgi:hypothetical protein
MASKAFRINIHNKLHLINLNYVTKVLLDEKTLNIYFNVNKGVFGAAIYGSGYISGSDLYNMKVDYDTKELAQKDFDDIAKLM